MADAVTPAKQRVPMASRLQSPTSPFFLGSNDDQLERAQARAARAAASRRKSAAPPPRPTSDSSPDLFSKDQILELFQNCIKLASENKINQKNTWDLSLIDHMSEIIKVEGDDAETNFQKASCTLEAGVKIYSLRVDSVHSEAYKVLGGINRAGREEDRESAPEDHQVDSSQEEGHSKKDTEKKLSPLSTLESSFEALNVKKFDVAFTVDPLYHQTSAQFDEGGAKGLLLYNLGVYSGCRVLFDSLERPGKNMASAAQNDKTEVIDISFARDCIEEMMTCMPRKNDISPSLREIVNRFDEDNRRPPEMFCADQKEADQDDEVGNDQEWEGNTLGDYAGPCSVDGEDQPSVLDESSTFVDINSSSKFEETYGFSFQEPDFDDGMDKISEFLSLGLGFNSKLNSWAGPDHWKYRKAKEQAPTSEAGSTIKNKSSKAKRQAMIDIDFTKSIDTDTPDVFALPKNRKSLLLPVNRSPCNTLLPEDCHYQPENLVKLFLLPDVLCLGRKRRSMDDSRQQSHVYNQSLDNESMMGDDFADGNVLSDMEDSTALVSQPRQVNKLEVQYDKSSKQVDVHALKEVLWNCMQQSVENNQMGNEAPVSFKLVLSSIPADCTAAATTKDISPHLCFICLLHLANEHGLSIQDCATLDELWIHLPQHVQ